MNIDESIYLLDKLIDAGGNGLITIYMMAIILKTVKSFIVIL